MAVSSVKASSVDWGTNQVQGQEAAARQASGGANQGQGDILISIKSYELRLEHNYHALKVHRVLVIQKEAEY